MGIKECYRGPSGKTLPGLELDLDEALKRLSKLFALKEVVLAYLFGSYAEGTNDSSSDLDLALFLGNHKQKRNALYMELFADIQQAISTERFDLILLDYASPLLKREIVSSGQVIYARTKEEQFNFEIETMRQYLDTAYLRKVQNEYLKTRVKQWYLEKKAL